MADSDADATRTCKHTDVRPGGYHGPRLPLQYGSAEIEICSDCGMWRRDKSVPKFQRSWRPAVDLLIAIARGHEDE